jgi:hypothetical protein
MTTLSQLQKDCIFGTLLGDGNLQTENQGRTWRYRALHKHEHKQYLCNKYEILKPLCSSPPAYGKVFDPRTGKTYERNYFNTTQQSSLKFFGDMFYSYNPTLNKWVKDVPLKVEKFLTPTALAYFYMDDGALKWLNNSNAMRICTESFSQHGVERLQKVLLKLYKVDTTTCKHGTGFRILIPEQSSATFREVIQPYLVDCMKYKVSDGQKGHL